MHCLKKTNIPNIISVFRIALVPLFLYLFLHKGDMVRAMLVFLFAGLSDVIDGIIARKFNWISNVGKVLDPLADKCMQIAALVCMGVSRFVSWWIVGVLIAKEFVLFVGALCALKKKRVYVQSDWYGKLATVAFYIIAVILVFFKDMPDTIRVLLGVFLILFMLFALIMYSINYKKRISVLKNVTKERQSINNSVIWDRDLAPPQEICI